MELENTIKSETELPQNEQVREYDELRLLLSAIMILWKKRLLIISCMAVSGVLIVVYVLMLDPVYTSFSIITQKDTEKSIGSGLINQMGGLGSLVAAQMGMGTTSLENIKIILLSHDLAEAVIRKNNLLPLLFNRKYDFAKRIWKDSVDTPTVAKGVLKMNEKVLKVNLDNKRNVLVINAEFYDSLMAPKLINYYLDELENRLKQDAIFESNKKRSFYEKQMKGTLDPWLMQKLQNLISIEIEKEALVVGSSFKILETPAVPIIKSGPKKKRIVVLFMACIFFVLSGGVLLVDKVKRIAK